MSLRIEFAEFLIDVKAAAADGKITADEIEKIAPQFADVLAPLVDSLDPNNPQAAERLANEAVEVANAAIDALPPGKLGLKPLAKAGVAYAVPQLVEQATQFGQPAHAWIQANLVPGLHVLGAVIHALEKGLDA